MALMDYDAPARRPGGGRARAASIAASASPASSSSPIPARRSTASAARRISRAGRRHDAAGRGGRRVTVAGQRHRTGPGHGGGAGADRRRGHRRAPRRASASSLGDTDTHALWRRHLGVAAAPASAARRRGRRQARCATTCSPWPASILQARARRRSTSRDGARGRRRRRAERIDLAELARIAYFRPDTLPPGLQAELVATRHYVPRQYPFAFTNGVQAS